MEIDKATSPKDCQAKEPTKTKFVHFNLSGIADVLWLATDGLENANLQHGELIWLDFYRNLTRFFIGTLEKKYGDIMDITKAKK